MRILELVTPLCSRVLIWTEGTLSVCVVTELEESASLAENADRDNKQTKADRYYILLFVSLESLIKGPSIVQAVF